MTARDKKRIKPVIEEVVEESPIEETPVAETVSPVERPSVEVKSQELAEEQVETPNIASMEELAVESAPPEKPQEVRTKDNKMNLKLVVIITLVSALVAAFVSGGVYVYLSGLEDINRDPENEIILEPEPTPETSPTPSPTAEAEIDLSEYSVQVLNGSGAIGAASGGEDVLTEAGFNVENTGNASRYDFENTTIQTKSSVPASVVSELEQALEEGDYEVEVGEALPASSQYDIIVTVGRK